MEQATLVGMHAICVGFVGHLCLVLGVQFRGARTPLRRASHRRCSLFFARRPLRLCDSAALR